MSITINENAVLHELKTVTSNEGGVLYELDNVHANENGVLYEIYTKETWETPSITSLNPDNNATYSNPATMTMGNDGNSITITMPPTTTYSASLPGYTSANFGYYSNTFTFTEPTLVTMSMGMSDSYYNNTRTCSCGCAIQTASGTISSGATSTDTTIACFVQKYQSGYNTYSTSKNTSFSTVFPAGTYYISLWNIGYSTDTSGSTCYTVFSTFYFNISFGKA